jgi:hypothetical protein
MKNRFELLHFCYSAISKITLFLAQTCRKDYGFIIMLISLAVTGAIAMAYATTSGVGLSPDSVHYIAVAQNLLNGNGFSDYSFLGMQTPFSIQPPLFPMAIAVIGSFGIAPLEAARWLSICLLGMNVFITGVIIYKNTDKNVGLSLFGSFLVLTSLQIIRVHSMAWTEPLFILLSVTGLSVLGSYVRTLKLSSLIFSACLISLAFLDRYVGITLVATGFVSVFWFKERSLNENIRNTAVFVTISCLPITLWLAKNFFCTGSLTGRDMVFHPFSLTDIHDLLNVMSHWIFPARLTGAAKLTISFALIMLFSLIYFKSKKMLIGLELALIRLFSVWAAIYLFFLFFSKTFIDANPPFDFRLLSPLYIPSVIIGICLCRAIVLQLKVQKHILKVVSLSLCLYFIGFYIPRATSWLRFAHANGLEYASRDWKNTGEVVASALSMVPIKTVLYTNVADGLRMISSRPVSQIPVKIDLFSLRKNRNYLSELQAMNDNMRNAGALLIFFRNPPDLLGRFPSEAELCQGLQLRLKIKGPSWAIYQK